MMAETEKKLPCRIDAPKRMICPGRKNPKEEKRL